MQRYPLISSTHVAPKAQGEDWHSLISTMERRRNKIYSLVSFYFVRKKKNHTRDLPTGASHSFSSVYSEIDSY